MKLKRRNKPGAQEARRVKGKKKGYEWKSHVKRDLRRLEWAVQEKKPTSE